MNGSVLKVNDLIVGCNYNRDIEYNNLQGIVLQDFGIKQVHHEESPSVFFDTHIFEIEWANGEVNNTPRYNLRKIVPDGESLAEILERVKNRELEVTN